MNSVDFRHSMRMSGEEPVFQCLKEKYGPTYDSWWTNPSTTFPKQASNTVLLVERRPHPNLKFVLQNAMYFCRDFSLIVVCSDESEGFVREALGHHAQTTDIRPLFKGIGTRDEGRNDYNKLFMDVAFWKSIPAEYVLSIQTDSYLLTPLDENMWTYDYIASPWGWNQDLVGGGGLTWRKVACCIDICNHFQATKAEYDSEDVFFAEGCKALGKKIPELPERITYFVESIFYQTPIGVHQWWTYLFPESELPEDEKEKLFYEYTTIHLEFVEMAAT